MKLTALHAYAQPNKSFLSLVLAPHIYVYPLMARRPKKSILHRHKNSGNHRSHGPSTCILHTPARSLTDRGLTRLLARSRRYYIYTDLCMRARMEPGAPLVFLASFPGLLPPARLLI